MARIYTPLLLTNIAVIMLMILRYQLKSLKNGSCPIFFVAIKEGVKAYYTLPIVKILSVILRKIEMYDRLPKTDIFYLTEEGTEFFGSHIILFLCSVGIVLLLGVIYIISLVTLDSTINKLSLKLTGILFLSISSTDFITTLLEKAPFIIAILLVFASISTCGSLALCLGTLFYFLKLTHMSQNYIEKVVWFFIKRFAEKCKNVIRKTTHGLTKKDDIKCCAEKTNLKNDEECLLDKEHIEISQTRVSKNEKRNNGKKEILDEEIGDTKEMDDIDLNELYNEIYESKIKRKGDTDEEGENKISENDKINTSELKEKVDNELLATNNSLFFHSTIFFLWCIITLLNLPAALTWAHNYK
ncbi:uncharacterized protein LOC108915936 [Anoplophora glabripennis]|uniref:uncharacterized protein LOC108915936 n=1 Tax=Anoplophora glabripennis TaxID=217634 RepID=UPI000874944C|nr:uncharacterized protein LOC108915936 [Anoplophora glabripennis]